MVEIFTLPFYVHQSAPVAAAAAAGVYRGAFARSGVLGFDMDGIWQQQ